MASVSEEARVDDPKAEAGVPFISIDDLREAQGAVLIDLRAPIEFEQDHLPGAINIPLFENETRSFVGLLYKQHSPEAAFDEARAVVIERVEGLVSAIAKAAGRALPLEGLTERVKGMTAHGIARAEQDLAPFRSSVDPGGAVVLSCARGGLRSRSVVALLRAIGLENAVGLEGGYKAFRHRAMETLEHWVPSRPVVVLRGLTGVGKTLLLGRIEELRPHSTLDLEGLAAHRSSLLGMVGRSPRTQKAFDSHLAARLESGFGPGPIFVEGESRKVGNSVIPPSVWDALRGGVNVRVTASLGRRVEVLKRDYMAIDEALPELRTQLGKVAQRMEGTPPLQEMLDDGRVNELVELLLARYYDPLYLGSEQGKAYVATIDADDIDAAAHELLALSDRLETKGA